MKRIAIISIVLIIFSLPFINFDSYYHEKEIRLGMSGPFTGSLHTLGSEIILGMNVYFKYINENGGIYGRTIRVIVKNDKYEPKIAKENTNDLITKQKVYALVGFVGTATSNVALPIAQKYRVPFIGAVSGSGSLRTIPRNPLVLNGRTSYKSEIEKFIEYFVDEKGYKDIAVFYQNDSYGRSGLKSVKESLRKRKLKVIAEASYKRNTLSVGHALYEISQNKPQVVILVGATKPTAAFISRARKNEIFKNVQFGAVSFVGSSLLLKALHNKAQNIIFSQVMPSPWGALSKEVGLYRRLMDKYNPSVEYSYISLEGFFIAKLTTELFQEVGKDFTKDDFINKMEDLYQKIQNNPNVKESQRVCKCLNHVYLTKYSDGIFWDIHEEN